MLDVIFPFWVVAIVLFLFCSVWFVVRLHRNTQNPHIIFPLFLDLGISVYQWRPSQNLLHVLFFFCEIAARGLRSWWHSARSTCAGLLVCSADGQTRILQLLLVVQDQLDPLDAVDAAAAF